MLVVLVEFVGCKNWWKNVGKVGGTGGLQELVEECWWNSWRVGCRNWWKNLGGAGGTGGLQELVKNIGGTGGIYGNWGELGEFVGCKN